MPPVKMKEFAAGDLVVCTRAYLVLSKGDLSARFEPPSPRTVERAEDVVPTVVMSETPWHRCVANVATSLEPPGPSLDESFLHFTAHL
jgi:hypothetical protein